jgi:hypothetical protein
MRHEVDAFMEAVAVTTSSERALSAAKPSAFLARFVVSVCALTLAQPVEAQSRQDQLLAKVVGGTTCEKTVNNGLVCNYKIGERLSFAIKDAGGSDTVIGFNHSDIAEEFYAVLYFGCVVVVPGHAHPRNYDRDYGVYVSPKNGRAYRTRQECQSAGR